MAISIAKWPFGIYTVGVIQAAQHFKKWCCSRKASNKNHYTAPITKRTLTKEKIPYNCVNPHVFCVPSAQTWFTWVLVCTTESETTFSVTLFRLHLYSPPLDKNNKTYANCWFIYNCYGLIPGDITRIWIRLLQKMLDLNIFHIFRACIGDRFQMLLQFLPKYWNCSIREKVWVRQLVYQFSSLK